MKRAHHFRIALIAGAALAALATPAYADESAWGDGVETIADAEMDGLRGGFTVPGTNINVNLGAVVTTLMNGNPVLTTTVTWTDAGAIVDQTMADVGESLNELPPEAIAALGLTGLDGAGGIVINDAAGITALVHNVTEGALQNIIVNSATGRDIKQDIDVTLTLPGFETIQNSLALEQFGFHLNDDMYGFVD